MQSELLAARERAARLEAQVFAHTAAEYAGAGDIVLITEPLEGDGARRLCDAVAQTCGGRCAVFSGTDGTYRYALIHAGQDIRPLVKDMNETLHGRGGGPRRLRPGQRRLHGGGDPGLFLPPVNCFAARNNFALFQQKTPPKCAEKAHFGDFLLWIYMIQ